MALVSPFLSNPTFTSIIMAKYQNQRKPLMVHRICTLRCTASTNTCHATAQRNTANYQPSLWSYDFLQSLKNDYADEEYEEKARKLQEDVRRMIRDENRGLLNKLELIDDIQRSGLGYRFETEITEAIDRFVSLEKFKDNMKRSLHETALSFRLLREHGHHVSPDVFERFKDQNGDFKTSLSKDVKGMVSLYEASFLGFEGEDILDEARAFTRLHLKELKEEDVSESLLEHVNHSLELPVHRRTERLEARWYIEAYGKKEDANRVLLEAATLDFNMVQSTLQRDLKETSRWWKNMGLATKLSFSRDRLMECFFWTLGMVSEPQYSHLRQGLTKVACLITTIDDVYDVYGTYDELELFTDAVERWDIKAVQVLPDYMKICFLALYNTVNEMAYDTLKEQGQDILPHLPRAWADMLKAFLQEARWARDKLLPTFKNYLGNAWVSVSGVVLLVHAYFLMNHCTTRRALDSLDNNVHELLRDPSIIFRLCNDLGTSTAELERGEAASSILCYMRENCTREEFAYKHIQLLVDETWKKMNKYRVVDSPFSKHFVQTAINLARISHCTYQYGDGHGAPDTRSKNRIRSLIIEPITTRDRELMNAI